MAIRAEALGIIGRLASGGTVAAAIPLERTLRNEDAREGDRLDEIVGTT